MMNQRVKNAILALGPSGTRGALLSQRLARFHRPRTLRQDHVQLRHNQSYAAQPIASSASRSTLDQSIPFFPPQRPAQVDAFLAALHTRKIERIWPAFKVLIREDLVHHLTNAHLSTLLISLRPRSSLSVVNRTTVHLSRAISVFASKKNATDALWHNIDTVVTLMREHNHSMMPTDYTHLLEVCRATDKHSRAEALWLEMSEKRIRPSTWAYNIYLAVVTGVPSTRGPLVDTTVVTKRLQGGKIFENRASKLDDKNVVTRSTSLYTEMVTKQIYPNSMTVELVITAFSRAGHISRMVDFIQKVWGVHVDTKNSGKLQKPPTAPLAPDSPLYPTEDTLLVIATCFAQNGQMQLAFSYVQAMATTFKLRISDATWHALLNWTFTLSSKTNQSLMPKGTTDLWYMMVQSPVDISHAASALDYVIRTELKRGSLRGAEKFIDMAVRRYTQVNSKYFAAVMETRALVHMSNVGSVLTEDHRGAKERYQEMAVKRQKWKQRVQEWVEELLLLTNRKNAAYLKESVSRFVFTDLKSIRKKETIKENMVRVRDSKTFLPLAALDGLDEGKYADYLARLKEKYAPFLQEYLGRQEQNPLPVTSQWGMLGRRVPANIMKASDKTYALERFRALNQETRRSIARVPVFKQVASAEGQTSVLPLPTERDIARTASNTTKRAIQ